MDIFNTPGFDVSSTTLHCLGGVSPTLVNTVYPMKAITDFHYAHHIAGMTGRWMDTGTIAADGAVRGTYHRLLHGHDLFRDGFKVLSSPDLKYGEFLHHLGLDFLTERGIANPLLPQALGQTLLKLGFSQKFVYEMMTVNLPKVLGGGLSLVCSGSDIYMMLSDQIPHTWLATGIHAGLGIMDTVFGMFPPNPLLLTAGAGEFITAGVTAYRTWVDPVIPWLGVPGSVFIPVLGEAIALAGIIGACSSIFTGRSWTQTVQNSLFSAASAAAGTTAAYASIASGCFLGPFAGPLAGIMTYWLLKKASEWLFPNDGKGIYPGYQVYSAPSLFPQDTIFTLPRLPAEPIGMLKNGKILLDDSNIRRLAENFGSAL